MKTAFLFDMKMPGARRAADWLQKNGYQVDGAVTGESAAPSQEPEQADDTVKEAADDITDSIKDATDISSTAREAAENDNNTEDDSEI